MATEDVKTPLARLAFAQGAWEVQTNEDGKRQYSFTLLFPKTTDITALQELALEAAKEKWGDKAEGMLREKIVRSPFLDGDGPEGKSKKEPYETHKGFAGCRFIRVISGVDYPPRLFNRAVRPATKDEVYSGVWGYAVVNAFAWENAKGGKGVSFGVSLFQAVKDDDKLGGGGARAEEFFEPIADEGAAPAETKSGAGAAGLFG